MAAPLAINGDAGGGQIVRNAFCYAALLGRPIRMHHIRATRSPPGLRKQHLTGLRVLNQMCGGHLLGDDEGSSEVTFTPREFLGGNFTADTVTAGSITLLIQITLPCLLYSPRHSTLVLKGGTDVQMSPPLDELRFVFAPLMRQWFRAEFVLNLRRRGLYPRGGGEVQVVVHRPLTAPLPAISVLDRGDVCRFEIRVFAVGEREGRDLTTVVGACRDGIRQRYPQVDDVFVETRVEPRNMVRDPGCSITVVAETTTGCRFGATGYRDKRDWVSAVELGRLAAARLLQDLDGGGCVDQFVQDQLVIFMCLAQGRSHLRVAGLTEHTSAAMELATLMTGVRWDVRRDSNSHIISCEGIALLPAQAQGSLACSSDPPAIRPSDPPADPAAVCPEGQPEEEGALTSTGEDAVEPPEPHIPTDNLEHLLKSLEGMTFMGMSHSAPPLGT